MSTLQMGVSSEQVRRLQLLLNTHLVPPPRLRPDGVFGPGTHRAVVAFQRSKNLLADGMVGPKTWAAFGMKPPTLPANLTPVNGNAVAPWMAIAKAELGVHEDALPGQHNARILEYHATTTLKATTDEVAWCSSFVNWVIAQSGRRGTNSAAAASWLQWGRALAKPQVGAVTVIYKPRPTAATGSTTGNHVGFLVAITPSSVRLLGGNQKDQVKYSDFSLAAYTVKGHRWPL